MNPSFPTIIIRGLGTAVPDFSAPQTDTLQFVLNTFDVTDKTKQLYKKTLQNKSIEKRHFALDGMDQVLDQNLDNKNARFQKKAVELSTQALIKALTQAGTNAQAIDFLAVTTCTGYLCPGLSSYLVESCKLKPTVRLADLAGMGCGAAIPALEQAYNFLIAHPGATAAVVCTEICTATMVSTDDVDVVISNTIFADGSAALILRSEAPEIAEAEDAAVPCLRGFASRIIPEWRDTLRFQSFNGHLKNVLGKDVPDQAAQATKMVVTQLLDEAVLDIDLIDHWVLHAGGEKILNALEDKLNLTPEWLESSRAVLKDFGNMSSPTVLFVLNEEIQRNPPQKEAWGILASFGAGFSSYAALVQWI